MALKSSVYALPLIETAVEDFQWIRREIVEGGGDASIVEAQLIDGLNDADVEALFRLARDEDYAQLAEQARALESSFQTERAESSLEVELARLEKRLDEIMEIDFYGASQRETAAALIRALRARLQPESSKPGSLSEGPPRGRVWVTRTGVHVDRIASAWLIRRFIDLDASFKFVPAKGYVPEPGELRFDMYDAEFTHEGDRCSFETLCARFELTRPGIEPIAQIVHDIDVKDGKFQRPETPGIASLIAGICLGERTDDGRLRRGFELFDALLAACSRRTEPGRTA